VPRSVWRGTLSFGLVAIPVSLVPATEAKDVRFHLFDREGRRVRYRRVVDVGPELGTAGDDDVEEDASGADSADDEQPDTGETLRAEPEEQSGEREVAYEDLVRGYEVEPEAFVFLEREDIERARPEPSRTIDLEVFVELEDIDPVYFEKSYYVVPGPGAEKPYELLRRTLAETGRIGIGRFVLRTKPHLVALRSLDRILALETLFFGDEVRDAAPLIGRVGDASIDERELEVSKLLVDALAAEWDPSMFSDEYREELLRLISERTPSHVERDEDEAEGREGRIGELLDALRRSVEEAKNRSKRGSGRQVG
jgi:DNA end-binding protein Ku